MEVAAAVLCVSVCVCVVIKLFMVLLFVSSKSRFQLYRNLIAYN
jgi:hypothetical protein